MARYCRTCGRELEKEALFCTECGTAVESLTSEDSPIIPKTNNPRLAPSQQAVSKSAVRMSTIALACAVIALLIVAFVVLKPNATPDNASSSRSASSTNTTQTNAQSQDEAKQKAAEAEKKAAEEKAAREKEEQEKAKRAQAEKAAAVEKDKKRALEKNPKVVRSTPSSQVSSREGITGTIRVHSDLSSLTNKKETICVMELPEKLTVDGTQYGSISSSNIIVNDKFAEYDGEVITIDAQFIVESSPSYPEAKYSPIWASNENFVRDYRV